MNRQLLLLLVVIVILPLGCNTASKYTRPEAPIPTDWPEGSAYSKSQAPQDTLTAAELRWQEFFRDTKLREIIETALKNNRDLQLAVLNVDRARAFYGVQRAELFPVIDSIGGGSKRRVSTDLANPGQPRTTKQFNIDLGITSWEIDFFGRISNLKEQALQEYLATEETRRGAQISLIWETSRVYLTLAADIEKLKLAQSTLQTQQKVYDLIRQQYKAEIATELDLRRVQTQVDTARVDVGRYRQFVAQGQNALNLLCGSVVGEELLPADLGSVNPPRDISPGLPSDVLLCRPDIMAAEHQLKGAYAFIGAARAAFFPRISLTTAIGTASDELSGLFDSGNETWSFAPQIVTPIFDSRIWAAYRVSESVQKIALTRYEKAIQTAFREVADALAVQGTVDEQVSAQESIVDSAEKIYSLSNKRYTNGIDSYLSVLDAQRSLYAAQQGLISLQLAKLANEVRFYAVLGGGGEYLEAYEISVRK